jgi:hypothetical protein
VRYRDRTETEKRYEIREDGARVLAGTDEVIFQDLILNVAQIALMEGSNGGRGLERATVFRGVKQLAELGYGYRCEMAGCSVHAKFQCQYGNYCSDIHARRVGFDQDVIVHEVYDTKKASRQMSAINISKKEIKQPKPPKKKTEPVEKKKETVDAA